MKWLPKENSSPLCVRVGQSSRSVFMWAQSQRHTKESLPLYGEGILTINAVAVVVTECSGIHVCATSGLIRLARNTRFLETR